MLVRILTYLIILAVFIVYGALAKRKAQGKVKYELNWMSGFQNCEEFSNEKIDASNVAISKVSTTHTGLSGDIVVLEEVPEGTEVEIQIEKETSVGNELMYILEEDFCSHLADENMPWSSVVEALNLDPKNCPITAKTYNMDVSNINMAFAEKVLSHEFLGQYVAKVTMKHSGEGLDLAPHTIACFMVGASVDETREEVEDDGK